jgi:hypothetical protein
VRGRGGGSGTGGTEKGFGRQLEVVEGVDDSIKLFQKSVRGVRLNNTAKFQYHQRVAVSSKLQRVQTRPTVWLWSTHPHHEFGSAAAFSHSPSPQSIVLAVRGEVLLILGLFCLLFWQYVCLGPVGAGSRRRESAPLLCARHECRAAARNRIFQTPRAA